MKALVIEDDAKIASFVCKGLKESGFTVEHAPDGEEGLVVAGAFRPDIIIADLMLPGMDGYSVIRGLRSRRNNVPVLILTAKASIEDKLEGFRAGTDDYLTKPFSFQELLARLNALIRRTGARPEEPVMSVGDLRVDVQKRRVWRGESEIELQPREYALLEYLIRNAGNVVSKTMIMEQIWSYYFDPQTNIVDVLIHRLRAKVDGGADAKLIHTVRGAGYVLKVV